MICSERLVAGGRNVSNALKLPGALRVQQQEFRRILERHSQQVLVHDTPQAVQACREAVDFKQPQIALVLRWETHRWDWTPYIVRNTRRQERRLASKSARLAAISSTALGI